MENLDPPRSKNPGLSPFLLAGFIKVPHTLPCLFSLAKVRELLLSQKNVDVLRICTSGNVSFSLSFMFFVSRIPPPICILSMLFAMRPKLVTLVGSEGHCEFCKLLPLGDHLCSYAPSSCTCSKRSRILLRTLNTIPLNPLRLKYVFHRPSTREQLRALAAYLDGPLEAEVISDWWVEPEKRMYAIW